MFRYLIDENFIADLTEQALDSSKMGTLFNNLSDAPILPLKNNFIFPNTTIPMQISHPKSVVLLRNLKPKTPILFALLKDENDDSEGFYEVGTLGTVLRSTEGPYGNFNLIAQGKQRAKILSITQTDPFFKAKISVLETISASEEDVQGYLHAIKDLSKQIIELSPSIPNDIIGIVQDIDSLPFLIHLNALNLNISEQEKFEILKEDYLKKRAEIILGYMNKELATLKLSTQIQSRVRSDLDKTQRDYFLRQQMKVIQEELGENESANDDIRQLQERLKNLTISDEQRTHFSKEIDRLSRSSTFSPDYAVLYNYLDFAVSLPWNVQSHDKSDIHLAKKILDRDHEGLHKIKDRILEFIAVLKLRTELKGPILCFCGPPGVGKTSLGQSIAAALGRKYARIALGGVTDEAELRGHRRTYIGAMPGRILQGIKRAGTMNPVFILDEIDKMGQGFRGDPTSALLEILDPAQNNTFSDHYLDISFDLSKVLFIATANYPDHIPTPLLDRMEIITINGYTAAEKITISQKHLIPRQITENGLKKTQISISSTSILKMIENYTRESGVRNLEREFGKLCRTVAREIVSHTDTPLPIEITPNKLTKFIGREKFHSEEYHKIPKPGVAIGLAWTPVGGDVLYVEAILTKGNGKLISTGQLGDVMKESATAALSYLKSLGHELNIPEQAFKEWDIHLHVPKGAIPKDGPSAGITILTALASAYTRRPLKSRLAMTGEITLRGELLPIGGIKEKLLAAKRFGISTIVLCEENRSDVEEILDTSPKAFAKLNIHYFSEMLPVLNFVLKPLSKKEIPLEKHYPKEEKQSV
ncbi:hypothetical protein CHS0354_024020 [Potamilus streckersoni]|uniref:Lon protease homolog n=1 Tax=Potamilus streckersoni TaxID=2493646 RepID=A0AAE0RZP2_9BIVA|nr:hypothetical protein CHS0354_024020 [Potamilus streckersoni]